LKFGASELMLSAITDLLAGFAYSTLNKRA
jgi:hypothetical protein